MTPTHKPLTALHVRPAIETSLFDFFKIGPGPSSSHTIGPMRAGHDFVQRCDALDPDLVRRAARIHVVLLGSLSATGMGHGTNTAVLAGLLRTSPETCPAGLLDRLGREADARHELRIHDVLLQVGLADIEHGPIIHDAPYSNTLLVSLEDADGQALFSMEYYSVGGGFIQWKGWTPPERGKPVHPYGTMRQLREQLAKTGLTLHELILDNESAITGMSRPDIFQNLEQIMESMYASCPAPWACGARAIPCWNAPARCPWPWTASWARSTPMPLPWPKRTPRAASSSPRPPVGPRASCPPCSTPCATT